MTHTPPVPPGNTSPFPLQEPPHVDAPEQAAPPAPEALVPPVTQQGQVAPVTVAPVATPAVPSAAPAPKQRRIPGSVIVTGLLGAGAVVAGVTALLFGNKEAEAQPRRRAPRKPAAKQPRK